MNKHITIALAVLLSACGGSDSTDNATTASTTAPTNDAPVALGKVGKAADADYTVTGVTTPKQIGPQGVGGKAAAGETYVVVSYTIKNTGKAALPFMERPKFSLTGPDGNSYPSDDLIGLMSASATDNPVDMATDLNPGVSAKGWAAWKLNAGFDKATWKLALASDPQLTFALK